MPASADAEAPRSGMGAGDCSGGGAYPSGMDAAIGAETQGQKGAGSRFCGKGFLRRADDEVICGQAENR